MAPERITMYMNSSIFTDDMIGSRVGLVPFRADPRGFKFAHGGQSPINHPDFGLVFEISTTPQKILPPVRGGAKNPPIEKLNIYSSNFKWIRHPAHPKEMTDEKFRPIHDDILLATLHPAQELKFQLWIVKGIGKDHAKYSPVSTAMYRPRPEIRLLRPVFGEEASRLKDAFPAGLIDLETDQNGKSIKQVFPCFSPRYSPDCI